MGKLDPTLPDASHAERDRAPTARPELVIAWHAEPVWIGTAVPLSPELPLVIGRASDSFGPGVLDDGRLSRRHLELVWHGNEVLARDLGSLNGSTINGAPLVEAVLEPGDVLGLGNLYFVFRWAVPRTPRAPHPVLVGPSAALAAVLDEVDRVAAHPTTVLLLGETGTGKELVARAVHEASGRTGAFVPVNCGGFSEELLQSELFGHTRGAFSGAAAPRRGLVLAAEEGTLFLDEIGEAPPGVQVSLLRLLQDREVRQVGSDRPVKVDVRFVAATNRDLDAEVAAGRFRADLLARLQRWVIRLPPLRERREDILPVALSAAANAADRPMAIPRALALQLLTHPWPGNLRELVGVVERLVIEAGDEDTLPRAEGLVSPPRVVPASTTTSSTTPRPDRRPKERPSVDALRVLLADEGGNMRALASRLGVGRSTLYRWFEEAGIKAEEER